MFHSSLVVLLLACAASAAEGPEVPEAPEGELFRVADDGKKLTLSAFDEPVLDYHTAVVPSPDAMQPHNARSGHIHPLFTPSGKVITGDMCPDHPHQHGVWFAWTSAEYDGRKIDFWNSHHKQGRVEHVAVHKTISAGNGASIRVQLAHIDLTAPDGPLKVLDETWDVFAAHAEEVNVIDLRSEQRCATDKPLVLKQFHYGGMGLRTRMDWNKPQGEFLTSDGKTRDNGNHTRPHWVAVTGKIDGKPAGVVVMQHPSNFRFPQPVRLHPEFSYFSFSPTVLGDFAIKPGQTYTSRYRYIVFDGEFDALKKELIDLTWRDYASSK